MAEQQPLPSSTPWRRRLYEIIFEAETPAGKGFDIALLVSIVVSVLVVVIDSVEPIRENYRPLLDAIEWFFTILFTIEYILRLICVRRPTRYVSSFFGVVDLLAILPTYISLLVPGSHYLLVIRLLRLLRVFRVLKLIEYLEEAEMLMRSMRASMRKISVFLLTIVTLVIIIGAMMYVIEGKDNGFKDIPTSIYWAIVTLSTVGYGDVSPQTPLGQTLASVVMLLGYGIIAVPTGIVTNEFMREARRTELRRVCPTCDTTGHDNDAICCKYCGVQLAVEAAPAGDALQGGEHDTSE